MNPRMLSRCLLDLVYPPACQLCGEEMVAANRIGVCDQCRPVLLDRAPACPRCGLPAPSLASPICLKCQRSAPRFDALIRLGRYAGALREAVLRTKHPRDEPLAIALARLLSETRRSELAALEIDLIVPIPMHWTRRLARGVNSPETMAAVIAGELHRPAPMRTLRRARRTQPQYSLTPTERRRNLRRAFQVRGAKRLAGARVLLVDDILTTGATANSAAATLKRAGASFVAVAVLSRAPGD
jgi:ComF family protein